MRRSAPYRKLINQTSIKGEFEITQTANSHQNKQKQKPTHLNKSTGEAPSFPRSSKDAKWRKWSEERRIIQAHRKSSVLTRFELLNKTKRSAAAEIIWANSKKGKRKEPPHLKHLKDKRTPLQLRKVKQNCQILALLLKKFSKLRVWMCPPKI